MLVYMVYVATDNADVLVTFIQLIRFGYHITDF